ncbi:hypothetical protein SDC9_88400 [bioreactor metagenome]|uniref:Uncharacterized protein n=1 Tax=bioreactor metagenome TaxID=1076179 RepID=A0A644ZPF8_9ZZZZ
MLFLENSSSLFFKRYHEDIPITTTAAMTKQFVTVWMNLFMATGDKATAQKSTISFLAVSGLNSIPAGYCIQAFATSIQSADRMVPIATSQVESKWAFLLTLSHPKNMMAKKVLSRKNAKIPSIASGAPKISPTNHE